MCTLTDVLNRLFQPLHPTKMTTMEGELFLRTLTMGTPCWPDYVMVPLKNGRVSNMGEIKRLPDFRYDAGSVARLRTALFHGLPSAFFDGLAAKPLSVVINCFLDRWDMFMDAAFGPELARTIDVDFLLHALIVVMYTHHIMVYVDDSSLSSVVAPQGTTVFSPVDFPVAFSAGIRRVALNKIASWTTSMRGVREETREQLHVDFDATARVYNSQLAQENASLRIRLEEQIRRTNELADAYHRDQERRETWGSASSSSDVLGSMDSVEVQEWGRRLNDLDTFLTPNDLNFLANLPSDLF